MVINNTPAVIQIVTFADFPALNKPVLSAVGTNGDAVLTWTYASADGITFDIYKSTNGTDFSKIDSVDSVLTYTDSSVCL